MKTSFSDILSIGVDSNKSEISKFGERVFNIDCYIAILGILMICIAHYPDEKFNEYLVALIVGVIINGGMLFLHSKKYFNIAAITFISYHFILIVLNTYITRFPIIALYLIPLGISSFIYFGEKEKYAVPFLIFFSTCGVLLSIVCTYFPNSVPTSSNPTVRLVSISLFFITTLYKMMTLVLQHRIALDSNNANKLNLSISEKKYRSQFENNLLGMLVFDEDMNLIDVNPAFCKMIGYTKKELIEHSDLKNWLTSEPIIQEDFEKLVNKEIQKFTYQKSFIKKNGDQLHIDSFISGTYDDNGILKYTNCSILNITEKLEAEMALKKSEEQYRTIFENAFDGIMVYDMAQKKIVEANKKIKGYHSQHKQTNSIEDFIDLLPKHQPNGETSFSFITRQLQIALEKGESQYICRHLDSNNTERDSDINAVRMPKPYDHIVVTIHKDITEKNKQDAIIRKTLSELNKKNIDLKKYIESNGQLENFAYMASHDLKAPLRTITSYSQLLARRTKGKLDETDLEFFNFIIDASKGMSNLIENLLNYSKANSQKKNFEQTNVSNMLEIITHELKADIDEKNVTISFDNIPNALVIDQTRIRQLFQNLISNAIKFIEKDKTPHIKISAIEEESHFQFSIEDNGIGIKREYHEKIFMLFRKLHGSGEYEGTGIGLALCKKIVEQHGGEIWVESTYGEGTTFFFTISKNVTNETVLNVMPKQEVNALN